MRFFAMPIFVTAMASMLAACSGKPGQSSVRVVMPDWNRVAAAKAGQVDAQSGAIVRVMLEAQSPRIGRLSLIWDQSRDGGSAPTYFDIPGIPSGEKIVVRVLAVKKGVTTAYLYDRGEGIAQNGAELPIVLTLEALPGTSNVNGAVAGRIVGNYTGLVNIYVHPGSDDPMLVAQAEVYGGWFNFFAAPGLKFTYRKADASGVELGSSLLTVGGQNPFDALDVSTSSLFNSTAVPGGATAAVRLHMPAAVRTSDASLSAVPEKNAIVGFFGMSPGTVCYPSGGTVKGIGDPVASPTPAPINWSTVQTSIGTGIASAVSVASGSITYAGTMSCTAGANSVKFDPALFGQEGNGLEGLSFDGPFVRTNDAHGISSPTSFDLNWALMAGANIDGVKIYGRRVQTAQADPFSDLRSDIGVDCAKAYANGLVSLIDTVPVARGSTYSFATDAPTSAIAQLVSGGRLADLDDLWSAGTVQYLICPYVGTTTFSSALRVANLHPVPPTPTPTPTATPTPTSTPAPTPTATPTPTPSAGMAMPATSLKLDVYPGDGYRTTPNKIATGVCTPIIIHAVDLSGNPAEVPNATLSLSSGGAGSFYWTSDCDDYSRNNVAPITAPISVSRAATWMIYYKTAGTVGTPQTLSVAALGLGTGSLANAPIVANGTPVTLEVAGLPPSAPLDTGACYSVSYVYLDAAGVPASPSASMTWTIASASAAGGWQLYGSNSNRCALGNETSNFAILPGMSAWESWIKYGGAATPGAGATLAVTPSSGTVPALTYAGVSVLAPTVGASIVQITLATLPQRHDGSCTPVLVTARDAQGHAVAPGGGVAVTYPAGTVFTDSACAAPAGSSKAIADGPTVLYTKATSLSGWSFSGGTGISVVTSSWPGSSASTPSVLPVQYAIIGNSSVDMGYCEPYAVVSTDGNGLMVPPAESTSQAWAFSSANFPAVAAFYSGSLNACQSYSNSISIEYALTPEASAPIIWVKSFLPGAIKAVPIVGGGNLTESPPLLLTPRAP